MAEVKSLRFKYSLPILFFFIGMQLMPQPVHAQFWKKIFGGHKNEKHRNYRPHSINNNPEEKQKADSFLLNKKGFVYPKTIKKERYRIDILFPLDLNKYVVNGKKNRNKLSALTKSAIQFYEGVRLAGNKLTEEGNKVDIYIHDIGFEGQNIPNIIQNKTLQSSDLIVGFLLSDNLPKVEKLASRNQINFLSVFSPSNNNITDNPYFINIQPTLSSHIRQLTAFGIKKYPISPPILLYGDKSSLQKEAKSMIEKSLKDYKLRSLSFTQFTNQPEQLKSLFIPNRVNVIYLNILSPTEASEILKILASYSTQYQLAVFGMPTWESIREISQENTFEYMNIYFSEPFYFNRQSEEAIHLTSAYTKEFGGKPSNLVFRGYETLYWVGHLLRDYGTIFNNRINNVHITPFTRFSIKEQKSSDGKINYLENQNLYIYHYLNGFLNISGK